MLIANHSLQALLDATGSSLLELRRDYTIVSVLSRLAFGYSAASLQNLVILTILHPDEHTALIQTTQALLAMAAGQLTSGSAPPNRRCTRSASCTGRWCGPPTTRPRSRRSRLGLHGNG